MEIFKIRLIRENILSRLSNADCSNLMSALRPTECWEHFFDDKIRKHRSTLCPICILNTKIPLLEDWNDGETAPLNAIQYPNEYAICAKTFERTRPQFWQKSELVFTNSPNLHHHKYEWALGIYSSPVLIKQYFSNINFENLEFFDTERALLKHIIEVILFYLFNNSNQNIFRHIASTVNMTKGKLTNFA